MSSSIWASLLSTMVLTSRTAEGAPTLSELGVDDMIISGLMVNPPDTSAAILMVPLQ